MLRNKKINKTDQGIITQLRGIFGCALMSIVKIYKQFILKLQDKSYLDKYTNPNEYLQDKSYLDKYTIPNEFLDYFTQEFKLDESIIKFAYYDMVCDIIKHRDEIVQNLQKDSKKVQAATIPLMVYTKNEKSMKVIKFIIPGDLCAVEDLYKFMQNVLDLHSGCKNMTEELVQENYNRLLAYSNSFFKYEIYESNFNNNTFIVSREYSLPSTIKTPINIFTKLVVLEHNNGLEESLNILGSKIISGVDNIDDLKSICVSNKFLEEKWKSAKLLAFKCY